jgi:glycosyltransferase involved in cell wall biosynthesis
VPAVSVIIPARDAAPTLGRTLEALAAQRLEAPYEVIVVDDRSLDDTAAIAEGHAPLVTVIRHEQGQGPGAARNRAVAAARAPVLAFTDADCFPDPDWLNRGLEALAGADLVQGRVVPDPLVARTPFDRSLSVEGDGGFYQTANLFVRRAVFEEVGGFWDWALADPLRRRWSVDHRRARAMRTPIGEDTQFAWEARRRGARSAYAPDALVHHVVVPGRLRDALADRWHWTRDMPGLVRQVPELRSAVLYGRVFFADWTAQFDLAMTAAVATILTRRRAWLLLTVPYARRVAREASLYRTSGGSATRRLGHAAVYAAAAPAVDAVTLAGLVRGSVEWRSPVL